MFQPRHCLPPIQLNDVFHHIFPPAVQRFVRVHRNALVALGHISALRRTDSGSWYVELEDVSEQPSISRRHLAGVKKRLSER